VQGEDAHRRVGPEDLAARHVELLEADQRAGDPGGDQEQQRRADEQLADRERVPTTAASPVGGADGDGAAAASTATSRGASVTVMNAPWSGDWLCSGI
jgi:hypothetical protein